MATPEIDYRETRDECEPMWIFDGDEH